MELQRANSELERSLEENARLRGYLARVVENLPCGTLVAGADGVQLINPEARHLLQVPVEWSPESSRRLPPTFEAVLAGFPANSFFLRAGIVDWGRFRQSHYRHLARKH